MFTRLRGATAFFFIVTLLFAAAAMAAVDIKDRDRKGVPSFVTGSLGKLARTDAAAAKDFLKAQRELLK